MLRLGRVLAYFFVVYFSGCWSWLCLLCAGSVGGLDPIGDRLVDFFFISLKSGAAFRSVHHCFQQARSARAGVRYAGLAFLMNGVVIALWAPFSEPMSNQVAVIDSKRFWDTLNPPSSLLLLG